MLSDEEKKAIEVIKRLAVYYDDYSLLNEEEIEENEEVNNSINIVINLIEKQSKEIEKLKAEKDKYYYEWKHLEANMINKIKAKIEEVKDGTFDAKIVLQSLLEKE